MKKFSQILTVCVLGLMIGCAHEVTALPSLAIDGMGAMRNGICISEKGKEAQYVKCLEEVNAILKRDNTSLFAESQKAKSTGNQKPVEQKPAAQSEQSATFAKLQGRSAPLASLPPQALQGKADGMYYIPGPTSAACDVNDDVKNVVQNRSNRWVEVDTAYAVPLECDAATKMRWIYVHRQDGTEGWVRAIMPGRTVKFTFLPLNGGWGDVDVIYRSYADLHAVGVEIPKPEVRWSARTAHVPYPAGGPNWIDITS